jgi:signal transduction histidine kinase
MPSESLVTLAQSQLELLAHSLTSSNSSATSKIKAMALYLPQENAKTGQLEFLPAVLYPHPNSERVFIASGIDSGVAPSLPKMLTKLPGFAHATSLLPAYPMVSSSSDSAAAGVGIAEEVTCDPRTKTTCLSVPLFFGSQTVGVLLVWPCHGETWTEKDKKQVSRAAQGLSLALSMDTERSALQKQTNHFRESLSDSLHQIKNPLQALRTYGKLLQQRIANTEGGNDCEMGQTPQLLALAHRLMDQSDRVVELLLPMDSLAASTPSFYLNPSQESEPTALTRWQNPSGRIPWANDTEEFSDEYGAPNSSSSTLDDNNKTRSKHASSRNGSVQSFVGDAEMEMSFIQDVLESIHSGFEAIASERGIDFQVILDDDELPGVTVCPKSLQEAVVNIIDNAFIYVELPKPKSGFTRNPSPRVRVRLNANKKPLAPGVTILVEDNGPGIPKKDRTAIFQRGFRSETTSSVEGSGIGLDISHSLISRMGGTLEVAQDDENHSLDGARMKVVLFRNPNVPS